MLDDSFRKRFKTVPLAISSSVNYGTDVHNHSEFEILYFEKGNQTVKIGDRFYHTKGGDIVCVNPMEIHSFTVDKTQQSISKCVCFDCSLIFGSDISQKLVNETTLVAHHIQGESEHGKYLVDLFLKIYSLAERSDGVDGEILSMEFRAYLTLFFAYVLKNLLLDRHLNKPKNADFCGAVISFVKEHYVEKITSKEVAEALSFNQSYFCRNFKKNFGVNFTEYLTVYRLSVARKLLEQKRSVTQVAFDCGFLSATQFSKCFKEKFGVLPSKYKSKSQ